MLKLSIFSLQWTLAPLVKISDLLRCVLIIIKETGVTTSISLICFCFVKKLVAGVSILPRHFPVTAPLMVRTVVIGTVNT